MAILSVFFSIFDHSVGLAFEGCRWGKRAWDRWWATDGSQAKVSSTFPTLSPILSAISPTNDSFAAWANDPEKSPSPATVAPPFLDLKKGPPVENPFIAHIFHPSGVETTQRDENGRSDGGRAWKKTAISPTSHLIMAWRDDPDLAIVFVYYLDPWPKTWVYCLQIPFSRPVWAARKLGPIPETEWRRSERRECFARKSPEMDRRKGSAWLVEWQKKNPNAAYIIQMAVLPFLLVRK